MSRMAGRPALQEETCWDGCVPLCLCSWEVCGRAEGPGKWEEPGGQLPWKNSVEGRKKPSAWLQGPPHCLLRTTWIISHRKSRRKLFSRAQEKGKHFLLPGDHLMLSNTSFLNCNAVLLCCLECCNSTFSLFLLCRFEKKKRLGLETDSASV